MKKKKKKKKEKERGLPLLISAPAYHLISRATSRMSEDKLIN
jgi:hypothetical protein